MKLVGCADELLLLVGEIVFVDRPIVHMEHVSIRRLYAFVEAEIVLWHIVVASQSSGSVAIVIEIQTLSRA